MTDRCASASSWRRSTRRARTRHWRSSATSSSSSTSTGSAATRPGSASTTRPAPRSSPRPRSSSPPPPSGPATSSSAPAWSAALPQPLGRRAACPARPPHPGPVHARRRPRLAADRREMIGLDPSETRARCSRRPRRHHAAPATDEPVTCKNDRWDCRCPPAPPAVLATRCSRWRWRRWRHRRARASPAGTASACCRSAPPRRPASTRSALHWNVIEERAANFGRRRPRQVAPRRPRCTWPRRKEQAIQGRRVRHRAVVPLLPARSPPFPQMPVRGENVGEMIDFVNDSGLGSIGTVDEAVRADRAAEEQSGGFGCYMLLAHEWANPVATRAASSSSPGYVMPEFQGQGWRPSQQGARRAGAARHLAERT